MTESSLKSACRTEILRQIPGAKIYNHQDRFLGGIPDTTITWGYTSWLEFKHLGLEESIHAKGALRADQLVELVQLEKCCHRAWVIAYRGRQRGPVTDIYRPSALLHGLEPRAECCITEVDFHLLDSLGVIRFAGHNHRAVARLILETHANADH